MAAVMIGPAISSALEHKKFVRSSTKRELMEFVMALNASCKGRRRSAVRGGPCSRGVAAMVGEIAACVKSFPARGGRRFGDAAFRDLHAWLEANARRLASRVSSHPEVAQYLSASFGDPQRLDYGTGHETAFLIFLFCLVRLGDAAQAEVSDGSLALVASAAYFDACRALQAEYNLEPAGSKGVWALDDYHCLAFLFGSAQHASASDAPAGYVSGSDLAPPAPSEADSLFFASLRFAAHAKTGAHFAESSPVLFHLAKLSWTALNRRVLLYYETDVLGKFIVARHLLFGSIFLATWRRRPDAAPREEPPATASASSGSVVGLLTRGPGGSAAPAGVPPSARFERDASSSRLLS